MRRHRVLRCATHEELVPPRDVPEALKLWIVLDEQRLRVAHVLSEHVCLGKGPGELGRDGTDEFERREADAGAALELRG